MLFLWGDADAQVLQVLRTDSRYKVYLSTQTKEEKKGEPVRYRSGRIQADKCLEKEEFGHTGKRPLLVPGLYPCSLYDVPAVNAP